MADGPRDFSKYFFKVRGEWGRYVQKMVTGSTRTKWNRKINMLYLFCRSVYIILMPVPYSQQPGVMLKDHL
jgi:hypothetical protein